MKHKKIIAMLVAAGIVITTVERPATSYADIYESTESDKSQDVAETPYKINLSEIVSEQQDLKKQRENCELSLYNMTEEAKSQFVIMNEVSAHLNEQYEKYSDYKKLKKAKEKTDQLLCEAKSLLMSTNGAYETNEYKFNIELTPDYGTISETNETFDRISKICKEIQENDMTVSKFRGFYDIGKERENLVKTALSAEGKITYQWGAKAEDKTMPSQLDCSGFVQWVYMASNQDCAKNLGSTMEIATTYEQIAKSDLKPGDIGMKNAEGTCFFDANGNVFYTQESAVNSNISFNENINKQISEEKKVYKKRKKKSEQKYQEQKNNLENKLSDIQNKLNEADELTDQETKKFNQTFKEYRNNLSDLEEKHESSVKKAKEELKKSISELKELLVDESEVKKQIGHVGIYAGKDENGNDTWIHCTGGDTNNVVITTESEYDGFKYFYSPLRDIKLNPNVKKEYIVTMPNIEGYDGAKTHESYTAITSKTSLQYKLQQKAETDQDGFRKVDGRYMIAVGTGVSSDVGRYIDLVLEDDTVIPCVIGDIKADVHTDKGYHIMTARSHCASEFIVDLDYLDGKTVTQIKPEWNSKVKRFIVYNVQI